MDSPELMQLGVALLAAIAFAAVVFAIIQPLVSGDRQKDKRVSDVTESRTKKVASRTAAEVAASRRKAVSDTLKDIDTRQKSQGEGPPAGAPSAGGSRCHAQGVLDRERRSRRPRCALGVYLSLPPTPMSQVGALVAGFVGTFGLPRWILAKLIKRRQSKFLAELANAIDVVVRGVKSGLPLNECLSIISRESPEPIAGEFKEVVEQQRVGVPLAEALDRLVQRMPLSEVKFLAIVISIQQQAGGNLPEALGNLSGVLRDRLRLQMKVKALSAEAKASAMVLASLPPMVMFMVYASSPDYIMPLFVTKTGNMFLLGSAFWMSMGVFVIRR